MRQLRFLGSGFTLAICGCKTPEGTCWDMLETLDAPALDPDARIYQTRERQTHHTDSCDVVGLLCLRTAKSGGLSSLVSSTTIFNEMRRRRPISSGSCSNRLKRIDAVRFPKAANPISRSQFSTGTRVCFRQSIRDKYIESARRFPGVAPLTPAQIQALDLFDELANDSSLNLTMELQPGDMQFVHNHTILHDRTAFEDFPEPERKRHLLRLWMAPPSARPLPEVYAERFGSLTPGDEEASW